MATVKTLIDPKTGDLVVRVEGAICAHGSVVGAIDATIPYKMWVEAADRIRFGEAENRKPVPPSPAEATPVDDKAEGYPLDRRERRSV